MRPALLICPIAAACFFASAQETPPPTPGAATETTALPDAETGNVAELTKVMMQCMEKTQQLLSGIKDKESAEKAAPELKNLASKAITVSQQMQKSMSEGKMTVGIIQELSTMQPQIEKVNTAMQEEFKRLEQLELLTPEFMESITPENAKKLNGPVKGEAGVEMPQEKKTGE